jgi:hypothetical protein
LPQEGSLFDVTKVSGFAVFVAVLITVSASAALTGGFFKSVGTLITLALDLADGRAYCIEGRTSTSWASEGGQGMKALLRAEPYWYVVQTNTCQ